jgi:hypothetical protein
LPKAVVVLAPVQRAPVRQGLVAAREEKARPLVRAETR